MIDSGIVPVASLTVTVQVRFPDGEPGDQDAVLGGDQVEDDEVALGCGAVHVDEGAEPLRDLRVEIVVFRKPLPAHRAGFVTARNAATSLH